MNQVVSAIIGVIATLFGLTLSPGLAPTATAATAQGYAYDCQHQGAASTHTTSERGPPATSDRANNQDADDHGPRGAAACPKAVLTYAYNAYDILARSARAASAGTTTQEQVRRSDNELSPHPSAGVAANAGSRLAEASSSAFRAADNVGDWTVSAKHLPGAGGRWNKWAEGVDINGAVANALRSDGASFLPNAGSATDRFIVRTNIGTAVGTRGETFVKAVVSNDGRIITAYPVK